MNLKTARCGWLPAKADLRAQVGGHAVVGVGYDDAKQWFIVRNS